MSSAGRRAEQCLSRTNKLRQHCSAAPAIPAAPANPALSLPIRSTVIGLPAASAISTS